MDCDESETPPVAVTVAKTPSSTLSEESEDELDLYLGLVTNLVLALGVLSLIGFRKSVVLVLEPEVIK